MKNKKEITNKTFYMAAPQKINPRNLSLDLNECKDLPRSEKLKSIKAFMDAVTESDFGNSAIEFPHAGDFEYDESFVRFKCVPYFKLAGLQDVICEFHYWPDYFNFEYHKRKALLNCNDDGELHFYPFTNDLEDYVVSLDLDETAYITFKKLTISALAEYFKLMPLIFPLD